MSENSVSKQLKKMWHAESSKYIGLREFARKLASEGNEIAVKWWSNKSGTLNQPRSEKNVARASLERQATKSARSKSKGGSKSKVETVDAKKS